MLNILGNIDSVPGHWFRIAYSRNAFLRLLSERGLSLDTLTIDDGEAAMKAFYAEYKPQHAEVDTLSTSTRAARGRHVRVFARRMQRHDHPVMTLRLVFEFADDGTVLSRVLEERSSVAKAHA